MDELKIRPELPNNAIFAPFPYTLKSMKYSCLLFAPFCAFFLVAPSIGQTPAQPDSAAVNHDLRIPVIIHSLEQVKSIRETQLSPDGSQISR